MSDVFEVFNVELVPTDTTIAAHAPVGNAAGIDREDTLAASEENLHLLPWEGTPETFQARPSAVVAPPGLRIVVVDPDSQQRAAARYLASAVSRLPEDVRTAVLASAGMFDDPSTGSDEDAEGRTAS